MKKISLYLLGALAFSLPCNAQLSCRSLLQEVEIIDSSIFYFEADQIRKGLEQVEVQLFNTDPSPFLKRHIVFIEKRLLQLQRRINLLPEEQRDLNVELIESELEVLLSEAQQIKNDVFSVIHEEPLRSSTHLEHSEVPSHLQGMIEQILHLYPKNIAFANGADTKTLKKFLKNKKHQEILFLALKHTATTLRQLILNHSKDIEADFKKKMLEHGLSRLSFAKGESPNVKGNHNLSKLREGIFNGVCYPGLCHVRYNGGDRNYFRIHLSFDHHLKMIVVTKIVDHLPTGLDPH